MTTAKYFLVLHLFAQFAAFLCVCVWSAWSNYPALQKIKKDGIWEVRLLIFRLTQLLI